MAIPTKDDGDLSMIDDLNGVILVRLRTLRYAGQGRDSAPIREALQSYVDKVTEFVNGGE
jgi:hypothetical protein